MDKWELWLKEHSYDETESPEELKINPAIFDPLIKSPCPRRPDTQAPCPLAHMHKSNVVCFNCGFITGNEKDIPDPEWIKATLNSKPELIYPLFECECKMCAFPGCECRAYKSDYCALCQNMFRDRKKIWNKNRPGEPVPQWFLHQPRSKANRLNYTPPQNNPEVEIQFKRGKCESD